MEHGVVDELLLELLVFGVEDDVLLLDGLELIAELLLESEFLLA